MADYDDEKDLIVSVTKSMNVEMVLDYKIDTTSWKSLVNDAYLDFSFGDSFIKKYEIIEFSTFVKLQNFNFL